MENRKEAIVISTSSLNSYGFRVLTEGIDIRQYKRNPILLWMHSRALYGREDDILPIGRIDNLHMDGDKLIGTPVFDEKDEFAQKIKSKWDQGIIKMASAGLEIIEISEASEHLVPGQTRGTVTKSKLTEVSLVDIGANDDAIRLYSGGKIIQVEDNGFLKPFKQQLNNDNMNEKLALKLGLAPNASENEILASIETLQKQAGEASTLRAELNRQIDQSIEIAVNSAVKEHRITADKKDHFVKLGKTIGLADLNSTLDMINPSRRPSDIINEQSGAHTYAKLSDVPADEIVLMRDNDNALYRKLYKAEYGFEPQKD